MTGERVEISGEELLKQGAEALAYKSHLFHASTTTTTTTSLGVTCLRKHRPRKPYRHPTLDTKLTTHRILMEARLLQRLRRARVPVPTILFVDVARGDLYMEFINGLSVRDYLLSYSSTISSSKDEDLASIVQDGVSRVMDDIGAAVARMHLADVCHGDLTTSNLLLTDTPDTVDTIVGIDGTDTIKHSVVVIDFGLGSVSNAIEDQAVDLYVLERAFLSTHPSSTALFTRILDSYHLTAKKRGKSVLDRLEAVRLRGRKRTMIG